MYKILAILVFSAGIVYGLPWNYSDKGPSQWGTLNEDWKMCQKGEEQSPINIQTTSVIKSDESLDFSYDTLSENITNTGHTLQINFNPGNAIEWMGEKYELMQFHFHTPSENTIDGKTFPLEIHFVHQDSQEKLLVVSVLFEEGKPNPDIQAIIDTFPLQAKEKKELQVNINPFEQKKFYHFKGSLTTPPCSENVQWIVMQHRAQASKEQLSTLSSMMGKNARDTQNLGKRKIYTSQ